jgi:phosphonate transport system substrate-binding protein
MTDIGSIVASRICRPAGLLLLCVALLASAQVLLAESESDSACIGFMPSIFKDRNESDVMASLRVWVMTLATERDIGFEIDFRMFDSQPQAVDALRASEIAALTLLLDEYDRMPADLIGPPFFRNEVNGSIHEEFIVISRKEQDLASLEDLERAALVIHDNENSGLATTWLDAELAGIGLAAASELAASVAYESKLSATVLGVFFGKYEAALVSNRGFLSMVELNPQIGKQLRILAVSPPVIPSLFGFRRDFQNAKKERLLTEVIRMHESVTGDQVLRVFKADRMVELTRDQLDDSLELLREWRAASAEGRQLSLQARRSVP